MSIEHWKDDRMQNLWNKVLHWFTSEHSDFKWWDDGTSYQMEIDVSPWSERFMYRIKDVCEWTEITLPIMRELLYELMQRLHTNTIRVIIKDSTFTFSSARGTSTHGMVRTVKYVDVMELIDTNTANNETSLCFIWNWLRELERIHYKSPIDDKEIVVSLDMTNGDSPKMTLNGFVIDNNGSDISKHILRLKQRFNRRGWVYDLRVYWDGTVVKLITNEGTRKWWRVAGDIFTTNSVYGKSIELTQAIKRQVTNPTKLLGDDTEVICGGEYPSTMGRNDLTDEPTDSPVASAYADKRLGCYEHTYDTAYGILDAPKELLDAVTEEIADEVVGGRLPETALVDGSDE